MNDVYNAQPQTRRSEVAVRTLKDRNSSGTSALSEPRNTKTLDDTESETTAPTISLPSHENESPEDDGNEEGQDGEEGSGPARKSRYSSLKDEDWEAKRAIITALYSTMSLEKMMSEMRDKYEFDATRRTYVRRLRKWGLSKNIKAAQKEAVVHYIQRHGTESLPDTLATIPLHRVQRYVRDKGKGVSKYSSIKKSDLSVNKALAKASASPNPILLELQKNLLANSIPNGSFLNSSPQERKSEVFLTRLREYTQIRLESLESQRALLSTNARGTRHHDSTKALMKLYSSIVVARNVAPGDSQQFYHALDIFCSFVRDALQESHWRMMSLLFLGLYSFCRRDRTLGQMVLRFVRDMALTVFSTNSDNCIVQMMDLIPDINEQVETLVNIGQVISETVEKTIPNDTDAIPPMNADLYNYYRTLGLCDSARRVAERNHKFCIDNLGPEHRETQLAAVVLNQDMSTNDHAACQLHQLKSYLAQYNESFKDADDT